MTLATRMGTKMSTISQWLTDLRHDDLSSRLAAAEALAGAGVDAQPAIVPLVEILGSADEELRSWCVAALEAVGPPATSQIGELTSLTRSASDDVAFWAVTLLGRAEGESAGAVFSLIERLDDVTSPMVQQRAAWTLGRIGSAAHPALNTLRAAAEGKGELATQASRAIERIDASRS